MTQATKQHPNVYISQLLREFRELQSTAKNSPFFVIHEEGYAEPATLPVIDQDSTSLAEGYVEARGFIGPQDEETTKDLQAYADLLGAELVYYVPRPRKQVQAKPVVLN